MICIIIYGYVSMAMFLASILGIILFYCLLKTQGYLNFKDSKKYVEDLEEKNNRATIILSEEFID